MGEEHVVDPGQPEPAEGVVEPAEPVEPTEPVVRNPETGEEVGDPVEDDDDEEGTSEDEK